MLTDTLHFSVSVFFPFRWEGGQHVPAVAWWPGKIPSGTINPIVASGLDLLPTFVSLGGGSIDTGVTYDGSDISASLMDAAVQPSDQPEGTVRPRRGLCHYSSTVHIPLVCTTFTVY